jgi:hypothetical protein
VLSPLRIVRQPVAVQAVNPGEAFELSVEVNHPQGVSYQWVRGMGRAARVVGAVNGGTGSVLRVENALEEDSQLYAVVVSGPTGRVVSQLARVVVNQPARVLRQPVGAEVVEGTPLQLSVLGGGTEPLVYQWYKDGQAVPGMQGSRLDIRAATAADAGTYTVRISNGVLQGGTVSAGAVVRVNAALRILEEPGPVPYEVLAGGTLRLAVRAQGAGALQYQWTRNGFPIVGATGAVLEARGVGAGDTGEYAVEVVSANARAVSRGVPVRVKEALRVLQMPVSQVAKEGGAARFRMVVHWPWGGVKYEWSRTNAGV